MMIPVLLDEITTTNNGIGLLTDMTSCTVTEELNGMWELEFQYPTTGIHYEDIKVGRLIRTLTEEGATVPEFFRIYRVSTPMTGAVTVYAQHITYQLNYVPVMPINEEFRTPEQALALMCQRAVGTSPYDSQYLRHIVASPCTFDFYADNLPLDIKKFGLKKPESMRSVIGGKEGGFLETFGGEIKWVGQSSACEVRIMASRGSDNGLVIEYGKNMTSLLNEQTSIGAITGICPYASYMDTETVELTPDEGGSGDITSGEDIGVTETVVTLPEKVIESSYASAWPFKRTACLDMSDRFTDTRYGIDPADLRAVAQKFVDDNALGVPRVSLEVGYLSIKNDLLGSQTDSANTVHLGDTVTIRFRELGIETKEKVVKTVYSIGMVNNTSGAASRAWSNMQSIIGRGMTGNVSSVSFWDAVQSAWSSMQNWLNDNPLTSWVRQVTTNVSNGGGLWNSIWGHADGGIMTSPHIGLVAEAGPEAIIPLSSARRGRAMSLYREVGGILGVGGNSTTNNTNNSVNINVYASPTQTADEIAEVVSRKINTQLRRKGAVFA